MISYSGTELCHTWHPPVYQCIITHYLYSEIMQLGIVSFQNTNNGSMNLDCLDSTSSAAQEVDRTILQYSKIPSTGELASPINDSRRRSASIKTSLWRNSFGQAPLSRQWHRLHLENFAYAHLHQAIIPRREFDCCPTPDGTDYQKRRRHTDSMSHFDSHRFTSTLLRHLQSCSLREYFRHCKVNICHCGCASL